MSEPLKDIRSKVNAETWALIEVAQKLARAAGHDGE